MSQRLAPVLAELRRRVDIVALIGRDVPLRRTGRGWSGLCPFHAEKNPSFVVYGAPRPGYLCHGCGAKGDAVGYLVARGTPFRDAVAQLAAEHGVAMPDGERVSAAPGGRVERALAAPALRRDADARGEAMRGGARAAALARWRAARPLAAGDAVTRYLAGRGLAPPPEPVLRCHPALAAPEGQPGLYPAMLALVVGVDGAPVAVHRTYLDPLAVELGGAVGKAVALRSAKAMLGPVAGGAVRLFAEATHLGVAEGIETALAAAALTGIPCWAALSAGGIEALALPFGVGKVTIFADRDPMGRGLKAAQRAAMRWREEHRAVEIRMPRSPHGDYADVLLAAGPGPAPLPCAGEPP